MTVTDPTTSRLRDPALPAFAELLGETVPAPLSAALAAAGTEVVEATAHQAIWSPGLSATVSYRARLRGAIAGEHRLVAVTGRVPSGAFQVEGDDGARVGVWRFPHDPLLPGLASAIDPERARRLVKDLGGPDEDVRTRLRAYRPGRRAVVEVVGATASLFLKLVPVGAVDRLHRTHRALESRLPVPASLGFDPGLGILALRTMPGRTLRRAFEDESSVLPAPSLLAAFPASLPSLVDGRTRPTTVDQLTTTIRLLSGLLPGDAARLCDMEARIGAEQEDTAVPVHGDFYESQILVRDGSVSGLLDLDTYGSGRAGDDPATMLAHLDLWRHRSGNAARVRSYAAELLAHWDAVLHPPDLRRRVAAVVAGLATGPFRVQRPRWREETRRRLDLAERWLESADRARENDLTVPSGSSHAAVACW